MRVLGLKKNSLNIQKCLMPDCDFSKRNHGRCCVVTANKQKFIVKIGLCEVKNIHETLFLDESVLLYSSLEKIKRTERLNDIGFQDFSVIDKISVAKTLQVIAVFFDFLNVKKFINSNALGKVVRDILKLYLISSSSCVFLNCLPESQRFGIYCVIVKNVNDSESNNIFRVNSNTGIKIEKCISELNFEQLQDKEKQIQVGGCMKAYNILKETLNFSKSFNSNIKFINKLLLIGPAGCGKTTLIHNVVSDCKCILLQILPSTMNCLTPVEMEKILSNIFEEAKMYAEHKECTVILIEDIDLMSSGRTLHSKKFIGLLFDLLEEVDNTPGVVVVGTTSNPDEVDSQLRRPKRLEDELEIMIPTADERVEIVENILHNCGVNVDVELLKLVSHWTPGFVGADLRLLVMETLMLYEKEDLKTAVNQKILKECFKQALTKVIPSSLRGTIGLCTTNNVTFSQIGGLEDIKKILDLSVKQQLENPEKFRKFGIPLTKGILLYGPPGCAKTTLVKALAKECNTTFLATSAADLYSPFVGDAEKKIVQLFTQARIGSPSILFIDEIDGVVGSKSGERERGVQERILSTLLIEMDGVGLKVNTQRDNSLNILTEKKEENKEINSGVIVIGATNRPQLLDDALKRPGRFDRLLYVPPPDELERFRILKKLTEKMPLDPSIDLKLIAKLTNLYSGADLKNLCQEAGLHALLSTHMTAECINQSHFEHILKEYKPSLNDDVVSFYENFKNFNI